MYNKLLLPLAIALLSLTSSCRSVRPLYGPEPFSDDFLASLKPDTRYVFKLKSGLKQRIQLSSTSDRTLSGFILERDKMGKLVRTPYASTFDQVLRNVSSISTKQFNKGRTTALVAMGVVAIALVISALTMSYNVGF